MRTSRFTAPVVVAAALLLTACGGEQPVEDRTGPLEGKTGPEVAALAADALEDAGSARVSGSFVQDGEEVGLDMLVRGDGVAGTATFQGAEIEIITVQGVTYLQATEDLLVSLGAPAERAADFAGRWLRLPPGEAAALGEFGLDAFAEFLREPGEAGYEDETSAAEVDGEPVVVVGLEGGGTLSVVDGDRPYPLELAGPDGDGAMTFSHHGEKGEKISAPDDVISPEELLGS